MTYGWARPIGCVLSIGTGIGKDVPVPPVPAHLLGFDIMMALTAGLTNSERAHHTVQPIMPILPLQGNAYNKYYRLNVKVRAPNVQGDIEDYAPLMTLDEYKGMDALVKQTEKYILGKDGEDGAETIKACAARLIANI